MTGLRVDQSIIPSFGVIATCGETRKDKEKEKECGTEKMPTSSERQSKAYRLMKAHKNVKEYCRSRWKMYLSAEGKEGRK